MRFHGMALAVLVAVTLASCGGSSGGGSVAAAPVITDLSPDDGAAGSAVTITGLRFGAVQGTSEVRFDGIVAGIDSWSDTSIVATVPNAALGDYDVVVTTAAGASNAVTFTLVGPPPTIVQISPTSGTVGTTATIFGSGFGTVQGQVIFDASVSAPVVTWGDVLIQVTVPDVLPGPHTVTVTNNVGASNSVIFTVVLPAAVFVHDDTNNFHGYSVDAVGALTPLPGSPYAMGASSAGFGGDSDSLHVHVGTRRLFATAQTSVAVWDIHPVTAVPTPVTGSPFAVAGAGRLFGIAVSPAGDRVFVPDFDNGNVHVLAVSAAGALTPIAGSPFSDGVSAQTDVPKLSPDGAFLYVNDETADPSAVHAYAVGAGGALTPILGNPFDYPDPASYAFGLEMSPQGRLYVPDAGSNVLRTYDRAIDGTPSENVAERETVATPSGIAFTRDGTRVFVSAYASQVIHVYDVNVGTGALTEVTGSPFTIATATGISSLVTDEFGTFLFAADEIGSGVNVLAVDAAGALTPVGTMYPFSGSPSGIDYTR